MLQFIAMLTMLVDHLGVVFFPKAEILRIIGRIAFPLYSWFLVQGYYKTSNRKKYVWRLFLIALLAQIPFTLALQSWELNVIFTLLLAFLTLYVLDLHIEEIFKTGLIIFISMISLVVPMDYGLYGILLIIIFRYSDRKRMVTYHMLLNTMYLIVYGVGYWIQLFSIIGTFIIVYRNAFISLPSNRWLYRSFYPGHLAILYLISLLLQR